MAIEKIKVTDAGVIEDIRKSMPETTTENKGLMPTEKVRLERRIETTISRVIYEVKSATSLSTSLLISVAAFGGGPITLFFMTINRSNGVLKSPTIILNRVAGASAPTTPRFKILTNETTGAFKIFFERTQYTPAIFVKIMNVINPNIHNIPFSEAIQEEVDAAAYINVT